MTASSTPRSRNALHAWWDKAAFLALLCVAVWAPMPLGSNRDWAVGLLAIALWLALITLLVGSSLAGHRGAQHRVMQAAGPLALMALFAGLLVGQLWAPGPIAGLLHTADAFQTRIYLLTSLALLAAFALAVACVNTPRRVTLLLGTLVGAGVLQALIAVALASTGATYQFMFAEFDQRGRATGTFVNPDHLAGYLELCLSAGLGLMLAQFGGGAVQARGWQQRLALALTFMLSGKMVLRMMLVMMVVALVMTHSRMGNGAFFFSLLLIGSLVAVVSQRLRKPALWLVASMALIDIIIIGQWVGLDRVVERLKDTAESSMVATTPGGSTVIAPMQREESIQDRLRIPRLSLPLIAQQPWFGHGGGTYYLSLPAIKPAGFPLLWDHAHNDFVELATDTGLVGLALLIVLGASTAWRAARMLRDAEPRLKRGVGVAALMAICSISLHGMVDFNLHIPANALTLVLLMALVWATPDNGALPTAAPRR